MNAVGWVRFCWPVVNASVLAIGGSQGTAVERRSTVRSMGRASIELSKSKHGARHIEPALRHLAPGGRTIIREPVCADFGSDQMTTVPRVEGEGRFLRAVPEAYLNLFVIGLKVS